MIKTISTTTEAKSLDDLDETWKIAARRFLRPVAGEVHAVWDYCGSLSQAKEATTFRKMAIMYERGTLPPISCVTGRDAAGNLILYARMYPMALRRRAERQGYA